MNLTTDMEGKVVSWQNIVSAYARPDMRKSIWQIINTLIPFFGLFYLSMHSVDISLWLTIPFSILTAGIMIRAFIIFHDCGHGSFFQSQRANDWKGIITGLLAFTPNLPLETQHAHQPRKEVNKISSPFLCWLQQKIRSLSTSDFHRVMILQSHLQQNLVGFQSWRFCKQILEQRLCLCQ